MPAVSEYFISQIMEPEKLIFTMFLRPPEHEEYKRALLNVYRYIKQNALENWVMDSTRSGFTVQNQKWSVEYLGVLLEETPLKKVAMVRGHDVALQNIANSMRSKIYRIFGTRKELQHFATLQEALAFLLPCTDITRILPKLSVVNAKL